MSDESDRGPAFARALKALAEGDADAAAELAAELLRRWPEDASVHQLMAAVALRASKPADAERWAISSLALRPDHYATLILAALAARALGNECEALGRFQRAAEREPKRPEAAFGAAAATIQSDRGQAGLFVEDLSRRFPDHAQGWLELGAQLERGRQWELAARAFANAMNTQPSAKLCVRLGSALQSLGRRDQAATYYQKALQLDPASAEAWFKLGLAFQDGRLPAQAAEAYRRALSLRPDLAEAEANLGVVLQEQGQLTAAKQAYGRAIELRPSAFGRVAQALTTAPKGELWMDLGALRAHLSELGRLSR
jgi:tetratricopeptide (TPR) repeat protein